MNPQVSSKNDSTQEPLTDKNDAYQQPPEKSTQWQALSAWSIISNVVSTLKVLLSNGYAIIPIVYTGWQKGFSLQWSIAVISVLTLLITLSALIEWRKFRYRIQGNQLEVKKGLLFTKKNEIPLNKIQNVRFEQPFYFRPMDLATLVVETAGSKKDEATLAALDRKLAQSLKARLLKKPSITNDTHQVGTQDNSADDQARDLQDGKLIATRSLKQLVTYGLYQNNFIWFAIVAGPIAGQIQWEEVAKNPLVGEVFSWFALHTSHNVGLQLLTFFGLLFMFYAVISLISVIAAVLKYHPYQLKLLNRTLQRSGGVISHQQDALKTHRIQVIQFEQPALARVIGRWTLFFKQVAGQEIEERTKQNMLVPCVSNSEIAPLIANLPEVKDQKITIPERFIGIHITWFYRRVQLAIIPATIFSMFHLFIPDGPPIFNWFWGATIVVIGLLYLRYRQWGYWINDNVVWQHTGLIGQNWKRIPYNKIQSVKVTQTRTQKRAGLAYIELGLASGTLTLPYVPESVAQTIVTRSLSKTVNDHNNWI
ncbi:PH domain-containing protein [Shewanella sp. WXL01]|uniref:PH domain-containing protein n=1 Tax=Shewanella sp. WXL01 TaxID=2709721 RepID=UPI00143854CB|nr:PH domain-containing protein [Shewanella sp. WXL01]NKF49665.1 PH domain-containing protein [Shewanella sp. WXL01]